MNSLLIPMLVEAYASGKIRTSQKQVPVMAPNYKMALATSVLGSRNTPGVKEKTDPLETGIHLHFILPDAFTHSPDGKKYPAVPNRYIVTRIWQNAGSAELHTKCTVVESDFLSLDKQYKDSISIPFFSDPDDRKKWRYLGRKYAADQIPAPGEYLDKLTTLGAGDPMFAAYYPNCKSVFGYYDDLEDLPVAPVTKLTYFVMGYYANRANDPFSQIKSHDDFVNVLNTFKFSVGSDTTVCDSCMVYGAIDSIEWKGFEAEYCPAPQGRVNVVFGNTSAEALSCAIQNSLGEDAGFTERMITALQYELYDEIDKPDGNFKIDDEIHFNAFSRWDGLDACHQLTADKNTAFHDTDIGTAYSALKKLGNVIGMLNRNLLFEQKKLFSCWEQYVWYYEDHDGQVSTGLPAPKDMVEEIRAICSKIQSLFDSIQQKKQEYDQKVANFTDRLPAGMTCGKGSSDAFYAVKEPVLLLSGPGVNRTFAFGEDGRFTQNGTLFCQTLPVSSHLSKEDVFAQCFSGLAYMQNLPASYGDLLFQTALICRETLNAIQSVKGKLDIIGDLPSKIAVNQDPFNWTTLFMIWGVNYHPTRTAKNADNTLKGWELAYGDTSLVYKGGLKPAQIKPHSISGKMVLTPHAVKTFGSVVNRYADIYEEQQELRQLADKIKDMAIISQNLSGFSDYFSGLWEALQFPIMGFDEQSNAAVPMVSRYIAEDRLSVLPDSDLLPMRGGYVKISDLVLVSSFGQTQPLVESSYYNGCEVDFAETVHSNIPDYGLLPPSFIVPARLNADFVSVVNQEIFTSVAPETSPVCGILVPEILNRRLLAYTADGNYLGMVKTVYRNGKPGARWLSAPGLDPDFNRLDISDSYFKDFLSTLIHSGNAFYEFYGLLDRYLDTKQNFSSLIWGRPLVLTRIKVRFQSHGQPDFSKRIENFGKYDTYEAERIRFKLKFGDMERVSDGLLGCFNDHDFSKLYPPFGAENPYTTENYIQYSQSLDISQSDGDRIFTLLIEPNTPFTIHTGIVPVKRIYFEASHAKVAQSLALSAEISPILGTMGQVGLPPLPQTEDKQTYKWYVLDKEEYQENAMIPPLVSFDETILMDGFIVKDKE